MVVVRMTWLFVLRCLTLALDTVLADMARFPRTEPFYRSFCSLESTSHIVYRL